MIDFGNIEIGDFDLDGFDIEESFFENRYVKPTCNVVDSRKIKYYFFSFERHALIPYIYKVLDKDNRFQLAVCGVHTKICQFKTSDGKHFVIHGSANLRSSGNIEQFTIEENEQLYGFYDEIFKEMVDNYATINKPIRGGRLVENLKIKVMASGSEKWTKGSKIKASTAAQKRSEKIKASKKG